MPSTLQRYGEQHQKSMDGRENVQNCLLAPKREIYNPSQRPPHRVLKNDFHTQGWNLMKEADKVAQPVMIISGKKDPVGLWTENGNNAKIIGESHSPHLDKIEEFAATILSFYNASEQ